MAESRPRLATNYFYYHFGVIAQRKLLVVAILVRHFISAIKICY